MRYLRWTICLAFLAALLILGKTVYTVSRQDRIAPEIVSSGGDQVLHLSVSDDESVLLRGLSATDDRDGDLSDKIMVERVSRFTEPGECRVSYVVFDSSYNVGRFERKVVYDDYTAPRFGLKEPLMYRMGETIRLTDRITLTDSLEGDLSHKIKIGSYNVPEGEAGIFEIDLMATGSYGQEVGMKIPLNVLQYGSDLPKIVLKEYLAYTTVGESVEVTDYVETLLDRDGSELELDALRVDSQVDLSKPGSGQLRLELTGKDGLVGISYLTVIVEKV